VVLAWACANLKLEQAQTSSSSSSGGSGEGGRGEEGSGCGAGRGAAVPSPPPPPPPALLPALGLYVYVNLCGLALFSGVAFSDISPSSFAVSPLIFYEMLTRYFLLGQNIALLFIYSHTDPMENLQVGRYFPEFWAFYYVPCSKEIGDSAPMFAKICAPPPSCTATGNIMPPIIRSHTTMRGPLEPALFHARTAHATLRFLCACTQRPPAPAPYRAHRDRLHLHPLLAPTSCARTPACRRAS
jgi:hypothetical protein